MSVTPRNFLKVAQAKGCRITKHYGYLNIRRRQGNAIQLWEDGLLFRVTAMGLEPVTFAEAIKTLRLRDDAWSIDKR